MIGLAVLGLIAAVYILVLVLGFTAEPKSTQILECDKPRRGLRFTQNGWH